MNIIKRYNSGISNLSILLNNLAAIALTIMMLLVVSNVVLRMLGSPIQATYDYVEFLTAIGMGLALAYCAVNDGHISISLFMDYLPKKVQKIIDIIIRLVSVVFLFFITWSMITYAQTMGERGEIALTTGMPHAPFVYIVSVGIGILTLVVLGKLFLTFKNGDEE